MPEKWAGLSFIRIRGQNREVQALLLLTEKRIRPFHKHGLRGGV
jgi:hypothetical protein